MKERPITMTPGDAQKVHLGTKTQTRILVKALISCSDHGLSHSPMVWHDGMWLKPNEWSPYGRPGDRLWVREAFCIHPAKNQHWYKGEGCTDETVKLRYVPSILMPRWACRTVLKLTALRVERLQEIGTADAIAEGAESWAEECPLRERRLTKAQLQYAAFWESNNGNGSWARNPWVWVLEFTRVAV